MSRGSGTGYIPDKSHLMSSTLAMLDFFKDGEKAFSNFSAFLESNYDIRSSNTVRMTFATLCKWKLLYEVDFKTYTLTAAGADLLKTHSEPLLASSVPRIHALLSPSRVSSNRQSTIASMNKLLFPAPFTPLIVQKDISAKSNFSSL